MHKTVAFLEIKIRCNFKQVFGTVPAVGSAASGLPMAERLIAGKSVGANKKFIEH